MSKQKLKKVSVEEALADAKKVDYEKQWTDRASNLLKGRSIVSVRYLTKKEAEAIGWSGRCICITLDNGHSIFPSADDEGNDSGTLFTTDESLPVIPTF